MYGLCPSMWQHLTSGIMAIHLCYTRNEPSPFAMRSEVLTHTQKERSICLVWILNKQLCICFWYLGAGCWQPTQNEMTGIHAVLSRLPVSVEFPGQRKPQAFPQLRLPWQPQHRENGAQSWNFWQVAAGSKQSPWKGWTESGVFHCSGHIAGSPCTAELGRGSPIGCS